MTTHKRVALVFLVGTFCYTVIGQFWPVSDGYQRLPRLGPEAAIVSGSPGSGFAPNAVYTSTEPRPLGLETYGSWLGTDSTTGTMTTAWYKPEPKFAIFVAGYPATSGNSLAVELEFKNGERKQVPLDVANAGESWQLRTARLDQADEAVRMRLIAIDGSVANRGWLAFSEPFQANAGVLRSLEDLLRIVLAIMASVTFLIGPGLALRAALTERGRTLSMVWIAVPGTLLLALCGLLIWILRTNQLPNGLWLIAYTWEAALGVAYLKWGKVAALTPAEQRVFTIFLLLVAVACSKGLYSLGPVGELCSGAVSRTTEVGDRPDSRIQFHFVQLAANGLRLESPESRTLFAPYAPTSRGPVTGLAATIVVLLSGSVVPTVEMEHPWSPFDVQGFTAYRIFMVCLAATTLFTFYGLAQALSQSVNVSLLGTALLAASPFFVHETYFTWPKLAAANFVLLAFYCVLSRRVVRAGLVLGFAYLVHPLALLSIPSFALLIFVTYMSPIAGTTRKAAIPALFRAFAGCAVCAGFFFVWNWLSTGPSQGSFISYAISANGVLANSVGHWLYERAISVLNTIVPFVLFLFFRDDVRGNSLWGLSPMSVQFYLGYWTTLPFGVGIVFFLSLFRWIVRLAARHWAVFAGFVVMPFVVFTIYWGVTRVGMMREGLHPWFLMIFLFLVWAMPRVPEAQIAIARISARIQWLRTGELIGMLLVPTLLTRPAVIEPRYAFTDVVAIAVMSGASVLLGGAVVKAALPCLAAVEPETRKRKRTQPQASPL